MVLGALGASWGVLGRLGMSWGRLGAFCGRSGGVLEAPWGVLKGRLKSSIALHWVRVSFRASKAIADVATAHGSAHE